ncbi:hypothetical protein P5673_031806 [Acropora cervicornis]|uniref:Uncharacterized protein n=1 Tax=Acropora cervicornis TaxID=6130 RepID=A0AAD9PSI4_ACRCE|nr:hypothetical protein P5673_031806 [Acropora cervicornis]
MVDLPSLPLTGFIWSVGISLEENIFDLPLLVDDVKYLEYILPLNKDSTMIYHTLKTGWL